MNARASVVSQRLHLVTDRDGSIDRLTHINNNSFKFILDDLGFFSVVLWSNVYNNIMINCFCGNNFKATWVEILFIVIVKKIDYISWQFRCLYFLNRYPQQIVTLFYFWWTNKSMKSRNGFVNIFLIVKRSPNIIPVSFTFSHNVTCQKI